MRIGIDIRELDPNIKTGIGRLILNFLEFVRLNDTEDDYLLFANQNTDLPNLSGRIKVKVIPEFLKIYWDQKILTDQIKKEKIDIFYSPYYKGPIFSSAKLIVTCNDLYFLGRSGNLIIDWLKWNYTRLIFKKADLIIAISQYSKREAMRLFGCSPNKVEVVYGSLDKRFKPLDKAESFNKISKKFKILKQDFILYVGNLNPHKNIAGLIKAYNLLPGFLKNRFQLVIVGKKDNSYIQLSHLVRRSGLNNNIEFLDQVSDDDLLFLYNAASISVLVSFWEGFGLPALEAMACGTAVVVSDTAALPEVVGDSGIYVNPRDIEDIAHHLQKILCNEALRKELSQKGLRQTEKFKVEYSAGAILKIFKELGNN